MSEKMYSPWEASVCQESGPAVLQSPEFEMVGAVSEPLGVVVRGAMPALTPWFLNSVLLLLEFYMVFD